MCPTPAAEKGNLLKDMRQKFNDHNSRLVVLVSLSACVST